MRRACVCSSRALRGLASAHRARGAGSARLLHDGNAARCTLAHDGNAARCSTAHCGNAARCSTAHCGNAAP
jgi:hypothetical protein